MANTLTGLIGCIYDAVDIVAREMVGFIPAVTKSAKADQVALNQAITYPIVEARAAGDVAAAATGPDPSGETFLTDTMMITKSRSVSFPWEGEEQTSVSQIFDELLRDQFAQAMRTLVNEIEADLAALYTKASRAYGTAGVTPFATNLADPAQLLKILMDNGVYQDPQLVINTTAGAALRTLAQLTKANEAGSDDPLRKGFLLDVFGFKIRESAQVKAHVKGTGTGWVFNGAHAVDVETIAADTGAGTLLAGDILAFEDDARKYVANTTLAAGTFTIGKPGLRQAQVDAKTITIGANYTANMAFARGAIHLLTRLPKMPQGGDAAEDVMTVTDPISGMSFQVAIYRQRRRVVYEVGAAWGVKAVKSEGIALLLG